MSTLGFKPRAVKRGTITHAAVVGILYLFVLLAVPSMISDYYVKALILVAIYAIVCLGLSVLVGRVGLVSMGQSAVLLIGAWVGARLLFATHLPYELVALLAGLITMVIGTLVGLPALRMRGLYLALVTLMLAGAITTVLATTNFPNGGHGFLGYNSDALHPPQIRAPGIGQSDPAFLRYCIVAALVMFALVVWHLRTRPGRAWAAIRQSQAAALAAGINVTRYKLWAFALASFTCGVAGTLLATANQHLETSSYMTSDSITLLAVVLMGGAYNIYGAIVAALLLQLVPAVLQNIPNSSFFSFLGNPYWLDVFFGLGVVLTLTTAPTGIADQWKELFHTKIVPAFRGGGAAAPAESRAD